MKCQKIITFLDNATNQLSNLEQEFGVKNDDAREIYSVDTTMLK